MLKSLQNTGKQQALSKTAIKDCRNFFLDTILLTDQQAQKIWPKKGKVFAIKLKTADERKHDHIIIDKEMHFVNVDGIVVPDLRTVHKYPMMYPKFVVDQGALKFMLKGIKKSILNIGANVMAPGLINEHSHMDEVQSQKIVAIYVQGHEHAFGVALTKKSTQQIRTEKEGVAAQMVHFVGDGFWSLLFKE